MRGIPRKPRAKAAPKSPTFQRPVFSFWASGMSFQPAGLYAAKYRVLARATDEPMSKVSGAVSWPFSFLAASISSWLEALSWLGLMVMPVGCVFAGSMAQLRSS